MQRAADGGRNAARMGLCRINRKQSKQHVPTHALQGCQVRPILAYIETNSRVQAPWLESFSGINTDFNMSVL